MKLPHPMPYLKRRMISQGNSIPDWRFLSRCLWIAAWLPLILTVVENQALAQVGAQGTTLEETINSQDSQAAAPPTTSIENSADDRTNPLKLDEDSKRDEDSTSDQPIDFATQVKPIFADHCIDCHGPDTQEGNYRLDIRSAAMGTANSGERPIQIGSATTSHLVELISGTPPEMPADQAPLTSQQIDILRRWIDAGAHWPDSLAGETVSGDKPWSLQPLNFSPTSTDSTSTDSTSTDSTSTDSTVAETAILDLKMPGTDQQSNGALNPVPQALPGSAYSIDYFVDKKLASKGLQRSVAADKRTLIRRLFFDVLGLPATTDQIQEFQNSTNSDAFQEWVEFVLASPQFGERWGRHWLDVVRFSESHGFEMNQERPSAFHYRDWVINALNQDLPFNEFAAAQIAGDQLGHDAATGFLVSGAWDQVKSPDINLTMMQREDELADVVGTTSTAFLGLTLACARCHKHKFDPLEQSDYYALKAVFAGVQHGERRITSATDAQSERKLETWIAERNELRNQSLKFEPIARNLEHVPASETSSTGQGPAELRIAVNVRQNIDRITPTLAKYVRFEIQATNQAEPCLDELEIWASNGPPSEGDDNGEAASKDWINVALDSNQTKATSSGDYPDRSKHRLEQINDGRYGNDYSWISNENGKGWIQIELPSAVWVQCVVWGRDREGGYSDRLATQYRVQVATQPDQWTTVADHSDRIPLGASPALTRTVDLKSNNQSVDQINRATTKDQLNLKIIESDNKIDSLQKKIRLAQTAYAGMFVTPPPVHRLYRGEHQSPRELVRPDIPQVFGSLDLPENALEPERRLALAQWIGSDDNVLVARVIVNRIWQYHFGVGIVSTPSDFGTNGSPPSHPALLDWLADQLINNRWSTKHIHRLILNSKTYQQANLPDPESAAVDSGGRLLWRFNPRRLESEAIRDSILWATGKLDLSMGGPGFSTFQPNDNYVRVYSPKLEFGPEEFRRMVYLTRIRMEQDATFGSFDSPDGGQTCPVRGQSTTPIQAFSLLNSPFILQQAEFLAERIELEIESEIESERSSQNLSPSGRSSEVRDDSIDANVSGEDPKSGKMLEIQRAFELTLGRSPSQDESAGASAIVRQFGLPALCRALFNTNEFLTLP